MAAPLIQLKDIRLTFGGAPLLEGADLSVSPGERICLVGRNGSGKSTLLRIAAGLTEPDRGTRFAQPGATVRYLPQEPEFGGARSTLEYVEAGLGPGDDPHGARYLLEQLGLVGDETPEALSGGEARRASLARVLAPSPDVLLLDEPTNHLDLPTIEWLERELDERRSACVIISHDRRFLANLSRSTVWLDRGRTRRIERGFAEFEAYRDQALAEEELEQHKLGRKIAAEEDWIRYGVTARRKRNVGRLAKLQAMRQARRDYRGAAGKAIVASPGVDASGALVIDAERIGKAFGSRPIVKDFSIRVRRGDRIGIVGPNGSGKTTLLNLLTGAIAPDSGTVRLGTNLSISTLDQRRASLDPEATVAETLTGGGGDAVIVDGTPRHVVSYMKDFLFGPEQAGSPVKVLSGGERGRLMLACALAKPSNLLVLDEPTNDLDLETLEVFEEALGTCTGTMLLISHDRDFLDRVVNGVVVPEGGGKWTEYAGGYSDMLAQRGADLRPVARKTPAIREREEPRQARPARKKLSYRDTHALATLPERIAALQEKLRVLHDRLDDPTLYASDRKCFEDASGQIIATRDELAKAEEDWLRLEILREEIEAG